MLVLSNKEGSLVAVATFVGVTFLFGSIAQLVVASHVPPIRWLSGGIPGVAPGIVPFVWPAITLYVVSVITLYVVSVMSKCGPSAAG